MNDIKKLITFMVAIVFLIVFILIIDARKSDVNYSPVFFGYLDNARTDYTA